MPTLDCEARCEITLGASGFSAGSGGSAGGKNVRSDWVNLGRNTNSSTVLGYMAFPGGTVTKESNCNAGDRVRSLGQEDPLEKGMATHSSTLAWSLVGYSPLSCKESDTTEPQTPWVFTFIGETLGDYANTLFLLKLLPANFSRILPAAVIPVVSNGEFLFYSFFLPLFSGILL